MLPQSGARTIVESLGVVAVLVALGRVDTIEADALPMDFNCVAVDDRSHPRDRGRRRLGQTP